MKASPSHIIARRLRFPKHYLDEGWRMAPNAAMYLDDAKAAYDAGTVEMCQGMSACGHYVELYAIPRRVREVRLPWFTRRDAA